MKKPELLAPAGNLEKLKIAVLYGADAVYLGGKAFGLRAGAGNFTLDEIHEGVEFAHAKKAKVYITVNIFAHNRDLCSLPEYLQQITRSGADAIIVSDPGIIKMAREIVPGMPIHLSTQANTTNWASAQFWQDIGISRLVLARELSLEEIAEIRRKTCLELEAFVHGAMCISYSGRCLLSNFLAGRGANQGECAHPCRWQYRLVEEKRPGEYLPIFEDERGSYILNSRDLCMLEHIPRMVEAGLDSFKIEGRMKSIHYVATIVKTYREAIDSYVYSPSTFKMREEWLAEVGKVSHRDYTTGFYFGRPGTVDHNYDSSAYRREYDFVALVLDYDHQKGIATLEERNRIQVGDELEFFGPRTPPFTHQVTYMENEEGCSIPVAPHPRQIIKMPVEFPLEPWSLARRKK